MLWHNLPNRKFEHPCSYQVFGIGLKVRGLSYGFGVIGVTGFRLYRELSAESHVVAQNLENPAATSTAFSRAGRLCMD